MPHELRENITCSGEAVQMSQPSGAKPHLDRTRVDYTEKDGNIEDDSKSHSQFIELKSNFVTELSGGTGNSDNNKACEISIEPDAGMLTQKYVVEDQSDRVNHSATHLDTNAQKDIIDVPITTSTIGRCLSYDRCSGDILQPEVDTTDTVAETVFSTEDHHRLQPQHNYEDQEHVISSAVATATTGDEPCVKSTCESQPPAPHLQLSINGVAADIAILCEDKIDEWINDVLQSESLKDSCHVTDGTFINGNCFNCIQQQGEHLQTKDDEEAPDSQTSDFYLTPIAVEDPPGLRSSHKEVAQETETRTLSKAEYFEIAHQRQGDVKMYCFEPDEKVEEGPAKKVDIFAVDVDSVVDIDNSYVTPENKTGEKSVNKSEVFETNVSQVDHEMSCVGSGGEIEEKPDDKADIEVMGEPHHRGKTYEAVLSPVATTYTNSQRGAMQYAEDTSVFQNIDRNKDEAVTSLMEYKVSQSEQMDEETMKLQDKTVTVMELSSSLGVDYADFTIKDADTTLDPQLGDILRDKTKKELNVDKNVAIQGSDVILSTVPAAMSSDGDLNVNETMVATAEQEGETLSAQHTHESATVAVQQMESNEKISSAAFVKVSEDEENTVICGQITFTREQQSGTCRNIHRLAERVAMHSALDEATVSEDKLFDKQKDDIQEPADTMQSESAGNALILVSDSVYPPGQHVVFKTDSYEDTMHLKTHALQDIETAHQSKSPGNTPNPLVGDLDTDVINNNPLDGSTEPPLPPLLERSDDMHRRSTYDDMHEISINDDMHEISVHDDLLQRSVHDNMHEGSIHDDMLERSSHDYMYKGSVHDDMHKGSVHDDMVERIIHDDMHEGSVHGDMHEGSMHDNMHEGSMHDGVLERNVCDDMHEGSVHDDMHERNGRDEMHEGSVHDDKLERSVHGDMHEGCVHDNVHERSVHDDMVERSIHDDIHKGSVRDDMHEGSMHDDVLERSVCDDIHEGSVHDGMHEASLHDDMHKGSVHDDMQKGNMHEDVLERSGHDDMHEGSVHDDMHERRVHDDMHKGSVHDDKLQRSVHDDMDEGSVHDDMHKGSVHDDMHERRVHDDMHKGSVYDDKLQRSVHDDMQERSVHADMHKRSVHDAMHKRSVHDGMYERNSHDDMHEGSVHDTIHERSVHDGMHERSSHDDMHEGSVHDDMVERSIHNGMHEGSVHGDIHEGSMHDDMHEGIMHDDVLERSVRDDMHEGSVHDHMHEGSVHDHMHKGSVHDNMHEGSLHDDMHRRRVHDDIHKRSVHDDMHERSAHDDVHERSVHDNVHERNAHDDVHERNVHDDMHERSTHDDLQKRNAHDDMHQRSAHDNMYERSVHDDIQQRSAHDDMYENERNSHADQYTRIKSSIHSAACNSKLMVQFASPLASYIEYSNGESSCSSEDTQDAMETMLYLNNDSMYIEHDLTFTTAPKPWAFDNGQLRYATYSVSDSCNRTDFASNVNSKKDMSGYTRSNSGATETNIVSPSPMHDGILETEKVSPSPMHDGILETEKTLVDTECEEKTCETHKCFSCETCHINTCSHRQNDTFEGVPDKHQEDTNALCSMNLHSFSDMEVPADSTVDQNSDSANVAEVQEQCKIIEHSHIIRDDMKHCIDELLETVYRCVDKREMSTFRAEERFEEETDTTNTTQIYDTNDDDASKDRVQQTGNKDPPAEHDAEEETPPKDTVSVMLCDDADPMKQMIEERASELPSAGRSFKPNIAGDKQFRAATFSHECDKRKDTDISHESDSRNKLRKLAVGHVEDVKCCHAEASAKLQENDVGEYRSWTRKETNAQVEDQEVPSAETAHMSPQLEESIYAETSSPGGCGKQSNSESSFRWRYAPSIGSPGLLPGSVAASDYDPGDNRLPMLKTCNKPRRVGLSRRAHVCPLHPYFKGKSKAQFS